MGSKKSIKRQFKSNFKLILGLSQFNGLSLHACLIGTAQSGKRNSNGGLYKITQGIVSK